MQRSKQPKSSRPLVQLTARWWPWLWGAVLVLLVTIVYWPTLDNGFVSDDWYYIKNNASLTSASGLLNIWFTLGTIEQYYPLVHSMFWVEYHLWGLDPRGYHIINFLLHATTAVVVGRLLVRLEVPGAWLAAAIFAVHPVEVESVAWASERKNVLSCLLALGSILAYLRFSPPEAPEPSDATTRAAGGGWRYYGLALGLYVAALLSKTVIVSVPAVLLVIYWWKQDRVARQEIARLTPLFAVGIVLACITVWMEKTYVGAEGQEWDLSHLERLLIAGRALWFYAGKLVWPHPLVFFYPRWVIDAHVWWQYLFPAGALAVIVGLWWARTRIGRGPLAAVLAFAGMLTPALGFFNIYPFRYSFVADHYQYHASIALIALAAAGAVLVIGRLAHRARRFATLAAAGLLLPLALAAQQKTHVYQDDIALDEDIIARYPESWIAHYNLGIGFRHQRKYDESISHWTKAAESRENLVRDHPTVRAYQDELADCCANLGFVQHKAGRPAEAVISCQKAVEVRERLVHDQPSITDHRAALGWSYANLGVAQLASGRPADAEASHRKAIAIREKLVQDDPTHADYQHELAISYRDLADARRSEFSTP